MSKKYLYKAVRSGVFAALLCISSFLVIPIGAVPVTMTVLTIMLCGVILTPFEAFCATAVYVLMGAIGFPVFSGGSGGIGALVGITGGYIWSYPFMAFVVSSCCQIKVDKKPIKYIFAFLGCLCGLLICYFFGTLQYIVVAATNINTALYVCVLPFIPIDIIKAVCSLFIGIPIKKYLK